MRKHEAETLYKTFHILSVHVFFGVVGQWDRFNLSKLALTAWHERATRILLGKSFIFVPTSKHKAGA